MVPIATLLLCALAGVLFWRGVPLERLLGASQLIAASLAIIAAALLVRLNRTMPSLEWKSIDSTKRQNLTEQIVSLTREYMIVLAIVGLVVISLVGLSVIGPDAIFGKKEAWSITALNTSWPELAQQAVSCALGVGITLIIIRMCYVVWRDYDIVKLQKVIIDTAAEREQHEAQVRVADEKLSNISKAELRSVNTRPPRGWD